MMISLYLLLNLAVLWIVARACSASGVRLILMLFVLAFVVGSANNLLEAAFFGVLSIQQVAAAAVPAAIIFAILSPAAVLLAGRFRQGAEAPLEPGGFTPLTLLGVVVAYELLYWGAGTMVFPYVQHFYAGRPLPPAYAVAAMQIVRSLIFAGAAYPLLRSGLRGAPLVLALVYSIIAGVAPLLPDNPYMPPDIRFCHGVEVSLSNFLFGLVVGFLFQLRRKAAEKSRAA
jgi:hypothetical protein